MGRTMKHKEHKKHKERETGLRPHLTPNLSLRDYLLTRITRYEPIRPHVCQRTGWLFCGVGVHAEPATEFQRGFD